MNMKRETVGRHRRAVLTAMVATLATACGSSRNVAPECIAPANAGGGWDMTCRLAGQVMRELATVDRPVRVVNMPGAGGGVAFAHVVTQREDDPNVVVAASPSTTLNLALGLYGGLGVDDVRWVGTVGTEYGALAVVTEAPYRSLQGFVETWRADPGAIVFGGGSAMLSQDHMKILLLAQEVGIPPTQVRYVPFDGGGEALTTMLGGFIDVFSGEASEVLAHLEAGSVRLLTVLAPERLRPPFDLVPTAREYGWDVVWTTWRGFYVPREVSDSTYETWRLRLDGLVASERWDQVRSQVGLEPFFVAGPAFEQLVRTEVAAFRRVSRELGLTR